MIDSSSLILFLAAGLTLNCTPGPDMLYCATRSVGQGRMAGAVSALGIGGGSLVHMTAAAFGLSALLMYSSLAFVIVKYAGALYLVYLGLRMILSGKNGQTVRRLAPAPLWKVFWQGVITNALNPKVALFYLSFLPQFVDPQRGSVALQIILLGLIFNFTGTVVNVLVGCLFGSIGSWLDSRRAFWRFQRWVTGSVLIGLGVSLALPDRR